MASFSGILTELKAMVAADEAIEDAAAEKLRIGSAEEDDERRKVAR